jgi:CheY-like chemotaxis protein/HPt (histidine-containing phosphotransfer) domain-containing protein
MSYAGQCGGGSDISPGAPNCEHARIVMVPSRDAAIRSGKLILLAASDRVDRVLIRRQLRRLGYAADTVENGLEALSALMRTPYALLLVDCVMPEMEGFELARRIRRLEPKANHLPIIALTANDMAGQHPRSLAAGMDDSLAKPVGMAALGARLMRWMPAESVGVETASHGLSTGDSETAGPALNLALLVEYYGDDPESIKESLDQYVAGMKSDVESLEAAVAESESDQVQILAHRIKGAARVVGGIRLVHFSEVVESAAAFRDWPTIRSALPRLSAASAEIDRIYRSLTSG